MYLAPSKSPKDGAVLVNEDVELRAAAVERLAVAAILFSKSREAPDFLDASMRNGVTFAVIPDSPKELLAGGYFSSNKTLLLNDSKDSD